MARIRTIKPDFWTDEKITECSLSARLLFIGMLNFADDNGNLVSSAKKLKMQVFPADNIECQPLLDELIYQGVVTEYSVNGETYLNIKGFKKHQVISRPSKTNIPQPQLNDGSMNTHGVVSDGKEEEGKGRERKEYIADNPAIADVDGHRSPQCPHQEIISAYHEILPMGTQVRVWNETRAKHLQTRWREDPKRQNLEWWRRFFGYVAESDFLTGQTQTANGRDPFVVSLDWLIAPQNFAKTVEGKYHRGAA